MAGRVKLTYFPIPGRAFGIRLCLRAAAIDFEDDTINHNSLIEMRGPAGFNTAVPLGQLPLLTLPSGQVITQSAAILRWAGKKAGLYPADEDKALVVDEVITALDEMMSKFPRDSDPAVMKAKREEFAEKSMPKYFALVERRLQESGGPFITGKELTIADLNMWSTLDGIKKDDYDYIPAMFTAAWPAVDALHETVKAHPLVVEHGKLA